MQKMTNFFLVNYLSESTTKVRDIAKRPGDVPIQWSWIELCQDVYFVDATVDAVAHWNINDLVASTNRNLHMKEGQSVNHQQVRNVLFQLFYDTIYTVFCNKRKNRRKSYSRHSSCFGERKKMSTSASTKNEGCDILRMRLVGREKNLQKHGFDWWSRLNESSVAENLGTCLMNSLILAVDFCRRRGCHRSLEACDLAAESVAVSEGHFLAPKLLPFWSAKSCSSCMAQPCIVALQAHNSGVHIECNRRSKKPGKRRTARRRWRLGSDWESLDRHVVYTYIYI